MTRVLAREAALARETAALVRVAGPLALVTVALIRVTEGPATVLGRIARCGRAVRTGPVASRWPIRGGRIECRAARPVPRRAGRPVRADRHHRRGRLADAERIQPPIGIEVTFGRQRIAARIELTARAGFAWLAPASSSHGHD